MTATGHAVIGTVIAAKIGNPYLAFPLAFASHIVADVIPHWDFGTHYREKSRIRFFFEAVLDVVVGFVVSYTMIYFLFPGTNLLYTFAMVITAQLLDYLWTPYIFLKNRSKIFVALYQFSSKMNAKLDKPWGIINQVAILVLLIVLAIKY